CLLIMNPGKLERAGAVGVLGRVYRGLREESVLVSQYVLRVLHLLGESLRVYGG
ncbi:hypothetical protein B484DRAFT_444931, partial [Ochromonadaceae sp. CCMP2298]